MQTTCKTGELILYGMEVTPYTIKVVRALSLKGVGFTMVEPRSPEDFRRWNPETGLLPVLEVDGERIADSARILDWLDAHFPDPPLVSRDSQRAREQRRLESWVGETFFFYMYSWLRSRLGGMEQEAPVDEQGAARGPLARLGLLQPDGRLSPAAYDTRDGGPGPEFERRLDDLVQLLGQRSFFYGDRVSRADLAVFAFLSGLYFGTYSDSRRLLDERPTLVRFFERVDAATRPHAERESA